MFCDQCGKFNSPENEFCYNCGSPLVQAMDDPDVSPVMVGAELTATALGKTESPVGKKTVERPEAITEVMRAANVGIGNVSEKNSETTDSGMENVPEENPEMTDDGMKNQTEKVPETADNGMQNLAEKNPEKEADSRIWDSPASGESLENSDAGMQIIAEKVLETADTGMQDTQVKTLIAEKDSQEKNRKIEITGSETEDEQAEAEAERKSDSPESDISVVPYPVQIRDAAEDSSLQASQESDAEIQSGNRRGRKMLLIIEMIIMAAAAGALGYLLHVNYGPEQDARMYLCSRLTGDWENAYSYLNIGEDNSELVSADMYKKVMEQTPSKGFSDLSLTEVTDPAVLSVEAGIQEVLSSDEKAYKVVYFDLDDGEQKTEYVLMDKTDETYGLIFHRWKVNTEDLCASDLTLTVPEGVILTLNGCAISSEPEADQENATDTYKLDYLFKGSYTAELKMENGESAEEELQIDSSGAEINLSETELYPDQTLMDQVLEQFVTDYQAILNASLNGTDFSGVQDYFADNAISEGRAQTMYDNACSQAYTEEKGVGILKIELSDISAEYISWKKSNYAAPGDLVMEVSTTMSYTYTEDGGQTQKSDVQTSVGLLCYHQENGQWKIQSFS